LSLLRQIGRTAEAVEARHTVAVHVRWRLAGLVALVGCLLALAAGTAGAAATKTKQQRQMAAIVHEWSTRLNAKDNAGIARLFSLPAIIVQPPYEFRFTTRKELAQWHSLLPCSGTVVAIVYKGRYATAVFRLGNRGKTKCDGPGGLAAARFEIVDGKIRSWVQVPVPKTSPTATGPVA
jgi:hypothetical protein